MRTLFFYALIFSIVLFMPFRIIQAADNDTGNFKFYGTVMVDDVQLTQNTDIGYLIKVTRKDGSDFIPIAIDLDGLDADDYYFITIPPALDDYHVISLNPGGGYPYEPAIFHSYKDGVELTMIYPLDGDFNLGIQSEVYEYNLLISTAPDADAGPNQTISEGETVSLDGTKSTGYFTSYQWTQTSGTSVTLSTPKDIQTTFIAPTPIDGWCGETLVFQLTVSGVTQEDTDMVSIYIIGLDVQPTADADVDQTVGQAVIVTLDGTNSVDPDDDIASYAWEQITGFNVISLSDPGSPQPTFTTPNVGPTGEGYTFQLTVTDSCGVESIDTCIVYITREGVSHSDNGGGGGGCFLSAIITD